jgi:hypothetical protein
MKIDEIDGNNDKNDIERYGKFTFVGTGGESAPCGPAPAFSSQQRGHHVGFHPPL